MAPEPDILTQSRTRLGLELCKHRLDLRAPGDRRIGQVIAAIAKNRDGSSIGLKAVAVRLKTELGENARGRERLCRD